MMKKKYKSKNLINNELSDHIIIKTLLQIRSLRIKTHHEDYNELFYHCSIMPIHDQVKFLLLLGNVHNKILQIKHHNRNTRSASHVILKVPYFTNFYGKQQLQYQIPELINDLPIGRSYTLKIKLKTFLIFITTKQIIIDTSYKNNLI